MATVPGSCIPCDANPLQLICRCKGARKTGICSHILLTTHVIMAHLPKEEQQSVCNLKYMMTQISGAKLGKKGKGGRAKTIGLALEREATNPTDDNSPLRITW